jgi:hypothetical protein
MSVVGNCALYLVPIYREPDKFPVKTPSFIGRWHGFLSLTGDGSGGYYNYSFYFQNALGIFGNHAMWTLTNLSTFGTFGGTLVAPFMTMQIDPEERTANGFLSFSHTISMSILSSYLNQLAGLYPAAKMRFSDNPGVPSQLNIGVSPNTNGVVWAVTVGGEVFDERML